jgi:hypothetical protein
VVEITDVSGEPLTFNYSAKETYSCVVAVWERIRNVGSTSPHKVFNPSNAELNPIFHLLASLGAHHILHVSRVRVKYSPDCSPNGCIYFRLPCPTCCLASRVPTKYLPTSYISSSLLHFVFHISSHLFPLATVNMSLCYKKEGRGFHSRWCHWNFSLT